MFKKIIFLLLGFICFSGALIRAAEFEPASALPARKIAYLFDGPDHYFWRMAFYVRGELEKFSPGDAGKIEWYADRDAGWDLDKMRAHYEEVSRDPEVDLILMAGALAAQVASEDFPPEKPVILADLYDADLSGLPLRDGASGVYNFSYLKKKHSIEDELYFFRSLIAFDKIHILVDYRNEDELDRILEKSWSLPFEVEYIFTASNIERTIARIDREKPQALYLLPTRVRGEDHRYLTRHLEALKIPSFSFRGFSEVKQGALAARTPRSFEAIGERIAAMTRDVFEGKSPSLFPVGIDYDDHWAINERVARELNLEIPFEIFVDSERFDLRQGERRGLNLERVIDEALLNRWLFKIADQGIHAAKKDHLLRWVNYLPSFEMDMGDGVLAESTGPVRFSVRDLFRETNRSPVSLNQMIFSDPALEKIRKSSTKKRITYFARKSQELDIVQKTTRAYFHYLKVRLQEKELALKLYAAEQNLTLAYGRKERGAAGQEEVLRWESILERTKAEQLEKESEVLRAKTYLNEMMNYGSKDYYPEPEVIFEWMNYLSDGLFLEPYISEIRVLYEVIDYLKSKAIAHSPEIQALDLLAESRKKKPVSLMRRLFFQRNIFTSGFNDLAKIDVRGETGKQEPGRYSFLDGDDDLERLRTKRKLKAKEIERRIRYSLFHLHHSLPAVKFHKKAMSASSDAYEILQRKYARGEASMAEFVNAWEDKFRQKDEAINVFYEFFENRARFSRALGGYDLASIKAGGEEKSALDAYLKNLGFSFPSSAPLS